MDATQVAIVLDALVTNLTAAMPSPVKVVDGQPLDGDVSGYPELCVVGFSADRPAVEITQERTGIARDRRQETLSVVCLVSVLEGSSGPGSARKVRDRVIVLLNLLRDALAEDRTLGGAVNRAVLSTDMALGQSQTTDGVAATIECAVVVTTL